MPASGVKRGKEHLSTSSPAGGHATRPGNLVFGGGAIHRRERIAGVARGPAADGRVNLVLRPTEQGWNRESTVAKYRPSNTFQNTCTPKSAPEEQELTDRKSTRLNSSHLGISYA